MMNVANQVSLVKGPQFEGSSLKVGDFVFVRLLKQLENNKVIVSFAGQAFEATLDDKNQVVAKNPNGLVNGGFKAKILKDGDKILLQIQEKLNPLENQNIQQNPLQKLINQSDIKNYLQNLGLVPDSISYKIIQFIQQMGYHLDTKKIDNIRKIVMQFPGREKQASEIAMYLEEKGLPVTKENIEDLMTKILGLKDFDNNFLAKNNSSSNSDNYWICLPFQYDFDEKTTYGTIFLLKNKATNFTKLINIRLFSAEKNFIFRICLKNHHNRAKIFISKILFYIEPVESKKVNSLISELKNLFKNPSEMEDIQVEFSEELKESMFFSDDIGLISVNTNA